ncbi:MAG: Rpn family recombination-promoting nuclease/putative transposase [Bacteroidota bacterium]
MSGLQERYINPFTDFGFKKLFGEEVNKDLLLDFLNQLLKDEQGEIKSLQYLKSEQLGSSQPDRKAIFDLYCENERGEKFIVELQKSKQNFFKDRSVYYSTFPIQQQAQRGDWTFELQAVYTIAILDFVFEEGEADQNRYLYKVKLTDLETCEVFYDKLSFIYLEMPKFNKNLEELETQFEKWLYVLKHLPRLEDRPAALQERVFEKLFEQAEIAQFSPEERNAYEDSLKYYRDLKNVIDTAWAEGLEEGEQIGLKKGEQIGAKKTALEMGRKLLAHGMSQPEVQALTGLSDEEIETL